MTSLINLSYLNLPQSSFDELKKRYPDVVLECNLSILDNILEYTKNIEGYPRLMIEYEGNKIDRIKYGK